MHRDLRLTFHLGSPKSIPRSSPYLSDYTQQLQTFAAYISPHNSIGLVKPELESLAALSHRVHVGTAYREEKITYRLTLRLSVLQRSTPPRRALQIQPCGCLTNHNVCDGYQTKSPPNRCTYQEELERESWRLYYLPPKGVRAPTRSKLSYREAPYTPSVIQTPLGCKPNRHV